MLAYVFPPAAHVAAQRSGKFCRDLERFGWRATVVTVRAHAGLPEDPETASWIPASARVVRTAPAPLRGILGAVERAIPGLGAGCRRWVVPDPEVAWVPAAVLAGRCSARRDPPDALWTVCGPNSVALAGAWLARRLGVPWVLDLCNEWTGNPYFDPATPVHRELHAVLERRVLAAADAVTTLNPAHTELLARGDPSRAERFTTIEGGVDPSEVDPGIAPPPGGPLTFVYAGSVYGLQGPAPLLETLDALVAAGRIAAADVRVRLVGAVYADGAPAAGRVAVECAGRVPHGRIGHVLAGGHVLFFCLPRRLARQLPTKLYEYMATGRPILAIAPPESVAARRVRERGAGWVVAAEDREGLAKTTASIYDAWRRGSLPACDGPASAAPFTRERMAVALAAVLDRLTTARMR